MYVSKDYVIGNLKSLGTKQAIKLEYVGYLVPHFTVAYYIACLVVRHISTPVDWALACSANQAEGALNSSFPLPDSLQTWDG
jgi:hypothetical protein